MLQRHLPKVILRYLPKVLLIYLPKVLLSHGFSSPLPFTAAVYVNGDAALIGVQHPLHFVFIEGGE